MQHPELEKITLSMGVGEAKTNSKALDEAVEQMRDHRRPAPGHHRAPASRSPSSSCARAWPSAARSRCAATACGSSSTGSRRSPCPRIRDFRGINPDGFDGRGNYNLGLREQTIFPEIDYDNVDAVRGLNVTITTTAGTDEEGRALLRHLGMPFRAEGYTAEERAARRRRKQKKFGRGRR